MKNISISLLILFLFSCSKQDDNSNLEVAETNQQKNEVKENQIKTNNPNDGVFAEMNTNKGTILIKLFYNQVPYTVANFVGLAESKRDWTDPKDGKIKKTNFYDGLKFHRVIPDFMIQGGDPMGNGRGGPGYKFADELLPNLIHDKPGILSMANSGPNTNGSQFFITHKATPWLDNKHAVFGEVIEGMEVVNSIVKNDNIISVKILRVGSEAKNFDPTKFDHKDLEIKNPLAEWQADFSLPGKEVVTDSGLRMIIHKKGNGQLPQPGQGVNVHYYGMFENGKMFDTSFNRGRPFTVTLGKGQVIKGWEEALGLMSKGEKSTVIIPPELAYGSAGRGMIPANSTLIFEMELIDIK